MVRSADEPQALHLFHLIRGEASIDVIRTYIDEIEATDAGTSHSMRKLQDINQRINTEEAKPSFRRKVMDIRYLCGDAPFELLSRPRTYVTEDNNLVKL